ncbi:MAG: hypothetical protein NDI58_03805 [Geothrix sp.]|nr:hypothetical protein [Geothrix sp.]
MNPQALQLAAELGGSVLSAPGASGGGGLILVERLLGHGLPQVLVLGRRSEDLREPLEAASTVHARGLAVNVLGLVPVPGGDLASALDLHRRRLGALVAALDAGLPWLEGKPMLARRMPGRLARALPAALAKAPMGPLEKAELKGFLAHWDKADRKRTFRRPEWREVEPGRFETDLWPGVPLPEGAELRVPPLVLPEATALTHALRTALRAATGQPIPFLPLPGDPAPLHALRTLTLEATAFRGPTRAWERALEGLAKLPAPPHFCARC